MTNETVTSLDIATITSLIGLIASIIWNSINRIKSNKIQQDILMHDMVKEEISNWKYIHEQKERYQLKGKEIPDSVKSHIFNYYEYLAYLIRHNKIDSKQAKKIWKTNILGMYGDFKREFFGERKELRMLYNQWKNEKQN